MNRAFWKHYDPILLGLTVVATLLGLLFIFDAGYPRSLQTGRGHFPPEFRNQLLFLIPSFLGSLLVSRIHAEKWFKTSKIIWCVSLLLLLAVEFFGREMNGAKRWIGYGPINIQPAEFAKLATVLYLAGCFAYRPAWPSRKFKSTALWLDSVWKPKLMRCLPGIWVLFSVYLIEKEPDLGTGAVVAATAFAMLIPGGVSKKSILVAVAASIVGAGLMVYKEPYRLDRVLNHAQRWDQRNLDDVGYQTVQSELAMANGGVLGVGIGAGRAKHVMPATTTDFVMATVGEEFGLAGALLVIGVIGGLVWRLVYLSQLTENRFKMLVFYGVAAWIGIQSCVNIMMANGFLPAIGIPLPFISSGGSSLMALWLAIGVCQAMLLPQPVKETNDEAGADRRRNRRAHLSRARGRTPGTGTRGEPVLPGVPPRSGR